MPRDYDHLQPQCLYGVSGYDPNASMEYAATTSMPVWSMGLVLTLALPSIRGFMW